MAFGTRKNPTTELVRMPTWHFVVGMIRLAVAVSKQ